MPSFDAVGLGNMLISGFISLIVAFVTTVLVNRWDKAKQRKNWRRERLIDKRDRKRDEIKALGGARPTFESAREIYKDDIRKQEELIDLASEKFGGRIPEEQSKYNEFSGELKKLEKVYIDSLYRDRLLMWPSFRDEYEQRLEKELAEIEAEIDRFEQE